MTTKAAKLLEELGISEGSLRMEAHRNAAKLHNVAADLHDKAEDGQNPSKEAIAASNKAVASTLAIKDNMDMRNSGRARSRAEEVKYRLQNTPDMPEMIAKDHREAATAHLAAAKVRS